MTALHFRNDLNPDNGRIDSWYRSYEEQLSYSLRMRHLYPAIVEVDSSITEVIDELGASLFNVCS